MNEMRSPDLSLVEAQSETPEAYAALQDRAVSEALARTREWLQVPGHHLVGWHDADYPAPLRTISSPPLALFIDGDPALLWRPAVAVVGVKVMSRKPRRAVSA